ncbi:MAG: histidine kinase N-terminal 7TM domain-containing protein [Patescibacteria group bacterium]|nr:histidine kinase N-terminal 7TM domain-containing protein [Patescibacteria group bacterium]
MALPEIILLTVGLINLFFGLYILIKKRTLEGKIFFMFAFAMAIWNLAMVAILEQITNVRIHNIIFDRLTYAAAPFILIGLIFYFIELKTKNLWGNIKKNKIVIFLIILGLINLILIPTNLISNNPGNPVMSTGPLMFLLGIFSLFSAIYITYLCLKGWRISKDEIKTKFLYGIIGMSLMVSIALICNVILPIMGITSLPAIGAASSIFVVVFLGLGTIGAYIAGGFIGVLAVILGVSILIALLISGAFLLMFFLVGSALQK